MKPEFQQHQRRTWGWCFPREPSSQGFGAVKADVVTLVSYGKHLVKLSLAQTWKMESTQLCQGSRMLGCAVGLAM